MSNTYTVFDLSSREITRTVRCDSSLIEYQIGEGEGFISGEYDGNTTYVDLGGAATQRLDYEVTNLPLPCLVTIEGIEYVCTEQPVFEFQKKQYPVEYAIHVKPSIMYLEKEFTVHVDPA